MASINEPIIISPPFAGQRADLDYLSIPEGAAKALANWLKRDGKFCVRPGFEALGSSLSDRPVGMVQYDHHSGNLFTVIGTGTKWFHWNDSTMSWDDITEGGNPLTGGRPTHQIFRIFYKTNKAYLLGVNGYDDAPKKWDGEAATYSDMGGSPPTAKCMAICNRRLLLGNTYTTQANPLQVDVSAFNDFESGWGSVQTENLLDTDGHIVAMEELGNLTTAIYKSDAIYVATAQPDVEPFSFELRYPGVPGPASARCVVQTPGKHVILCSDGFVRSFNGVTLSDLPQSITSHILATADLGALGYSFGFYNSIYNEVWFIYRGSGSAEPNLGVIINLTDNTTWPIKFTTLRPTAGYSDLFVDALRIGDMVDPLSTYTDSIGSLSHRYHQLMIADYGGQVVKEGGNKDLAVDIPVLIETGMISPSDARRFYTIQEIKNLFVPTDGSQIVTITMGKSEDGEDPAYGSGKNIDLSGSLSIGSKDTSRLFSFKMTASADNPIQWRGTIITGVERGFK